jgi:flagellar basal-body rod modification protein FlgD
MSVSPVNGVTTPTSQAPAASAAIDYNSFLKLLTAEMQNQDPTDPADTTQWVGQFAQFSQVEQALQMNGKLDTMLSAMALTQAGSLIGRSLTSADGSVSGTIASVRVASGSAVATLADGRQVAIGDGITVR